MKNTVYPRLSLTPLINSGPTTKSPLIHRRPEKLISHKQNISLSFSLSLSLYAGRESKGADKRDTFLVKRVWCLGIFPWTKIIAAAAASKSECACLLVDFWWSSTFQPEPAPSSSHSFKRLSTQVIS